MGSSMERRSAAIIYLFDVGTSLNEHIDRPRLLHDGSHVQGGFTVAMHSIHIYLVLDDHRQDMTYP